MRTLFSTFYFINVSLALPQPVPGSLSLFAEIHLPPPTAVRSIAPAAEGWLHPSNLSLNFFALGYLGRHLIYSITSAQKFADFMDVLKALALNYGESTRHRGLVPYC
jgi:hypothetical protein